ncbi:MAG: hypothetical protein ABSC71_08365 [Candidatus Acidiferrales bacterium]|jgi:hypothetical protein
MNEATSSAIFLGAVVWVALVLPAVMIWGWTRWYKAASPGTLSSKLSLGGFILANVSVLLALSATFFLHSSAGSPLSNGLLLRLYSIGLVFAVLGLLLAFAGLWRRSPLRWPCLVCSGGVLIFWMVTSI